MARPEEFVADARRYARMVWDGLQALKALQPEWNALDYGTTLPAEVGGVARADVGAAVFDTANALDGLMTQGHATNLTKLL